MSLVSGPSHQDLELRLADQRLSLQLMVPPSVQALVIFVHGSGSNLRSPRNQAVAAELQRCGLATVLFDLLSAEEQQLAQHHLHGAACLAPVPTLMQLRDRLLALLAFLRTIEGLGDLPVGLFGSSTGAAIALAAAASHRDAIRAIVSRGGRPDLVPGCLGDVCCPTLLLVGSLDVDVLELNTWAAAHLKGLHELRVVDGAGHLFAEPGCLAQVIEWTREWFLRHLPG